MVFVHGWRQRARDAAHHLRFARGLFNVRSSRPGAETKLHCKFESAYAQRIAGLQRCVSYQLVVDVEPVQAFQIKHLPSPVSPNKPAVPPADVGQGQAQVGLAVPAEDHVGFVQFHELAARLQDEAQRQQRRTGSVRGRECNDLKIGRWGGWWG